QVGSKSFRVAVLLGVDIEHKAYERPLQGGSLTMEYWETGARELGARFEVEDPEGLTQLQMRFGRELVGRDLAHFPEDLVVGGGSAHGDGDVGNVIDAKEEVVQLRLNFGELAFQRFNLPLLGFDLLEQGGDIALLSLRPSDLIGGL